MSPSSRVEEIEVIWGIYGSATLRNICGGSGLASTKSGPLQSQALRQVMVLHSLGHY